MNKIILAIALICCLISAINSEEVGRNTDLKPDESKSNESSATVAVESVDIKNEKNDTVIKNENEKSEDDDDDDEEDDDELSSKELSAIDQILNILTNVVVALISPEEETAKEPEAAVAEATR